jgi:hypothetical protein
MRGGGREGEDLVPLEKMRGREDLVPPEKMGMHAAEEIHR